MLSVVLHGDLCTYTLMHRYAVVNVCTIEASAKEVRSELGQESRR